MLDHVVQHPPYRSIAVTPPPSSFIAKNFDAAARSKWDASLARHQISLPRGATLAVEGDQPSRLFIVLDGWVQQYRQLADGRRQIVGFCLPGDLCDLNLLAGIRYGHTLAALEPVRVAALDRHRLADLLEQCPDLERALHRADMIASNIQREWLVNIGVRSALERVAHLLCELFVRQDPHLSSDAVRLPITQAELAEATGLTSVHVNRTLRELRMAHGVSTRGKRLSIRNFAALSKRADHQREYLGLSPLDPADGERMLISPDLGFYAGSDAGDHGSRSAPHGWSVGSR